MSVLLIYPPVSKPGEPPAGIARLAGSLLAHGIDHQVVDASLESILFLLKDGASDDDRWTRRADRNRFRNLESIRNGLAFANLDRYKRAVFDINRVLHMRGRAAGIDLGLANFQSSRLSPLNSSDLRWISEHPEHDLFFNYNQHRIIPLINESRPELIGISLNFLSQALPAFAMAGLIRRQFPDIRIALGGGLITSWCRRFNWENPFEGLIDHLVAGPGEAPLLELLGMRQRFKTVTPAYQQFPRSDYLSPGFVLPYSASSGCYWNRCAFCPERAEGNPYHPVPVSRVISDLDRLVNMWRPSLIHILDNAISPKLLRAIADTGLGAPWYGFARVQRQLLDPGFCRALKDAGCVMLKLGLESGDQRVLDSMRKGITVSDASRVLHCLETAGITTYVYLLFGTAAETIAEARQTLTFTAGNAGGIGFLNLAIFNMPKNGPDTGQLVTRPFDDADLSLYLDFDHPAGWKRAEVRRFLEKEFKKNPAIAGIVRRDPPIFTSNHAPFFAMGSRSDLRRSQQAATN